MRVKMELSEIKVYMMLARVLKSAANAIDIKEDGLTLGDYRSNSTSMSHLEADNVDERRCPMCCTANRRQSTEFWNSTSNLILNHKVSQSPVTASMVFQVSQLPIQV